MELFPYLMGGLISVAFLGFKIGATLRMFKVAAKEATE